MGCGIANFGLRVKKRPRLKKINNIWENFTRPPVPTNMMSVWGNNILRAVKPSQVPARLGNLTK